MAQGRVVVSVFSGSGSQNSRTQRRAPSIFRVTRQSIQRIRTNQPLFPNSLTSIIEIINRAPEDGRLKPAIQPSKSEARELCFELLNKLLSSAVLHNPNKIAQIFNAILLINDKNLREEARDYAWQYLLAQIGRHQETIRILLFQIMSMKEGADQLELQSQLVSYLNKNRNLKKLIQYNAARLMAFQELVNSLAIQEAKKQQIRSSVMQYVAKHVQLFINRNFKRFYAFSINKLEAIIQTLTHPFGQEDLQGDEAHSPIEQGVILLPSSPRGSGTLQLMTGVILLPSSPRGRGTLQLMRDEPGSDVRSSFETIGLREFVARPRHLQKFLARDVKNIPKLIQMFSVEDDKGSVVAAITECLTNAPNQIIYKRLENILAVFNLFVPELPLYSPKFVAHREAIELSLAQLMAQYPVQFFARCPKNFHVVLDKFVCEDAKNILQAQLVKYVLGRRMLFWKALPTVLNSVQDAANLLRLTLNDSRKMVEMGDRVLARCKEKNFDLSAEMQAEFEYTTLITVVNAYAKEAPGKLIQWLEYLINQSAAKLEVILGCWAHYHRETQDLLRPQLGEYMLNHIELLFPTTEIFLKHVKSLASTCSLRQRGLIIGPLVEKFAQLKSPSEPDFWEYKRQISQEQHASLSACPKQGASGAPLPDPSRVQAPVANPSLRISELMRGSILQSAADMQRVAAARMREVAPNFGSDASFSSAGMQC